MSVLERIYLHCNYKKFFPVHLLMHSFCMSQNYQAKYMTTYLFRILD